MRVIHSKVSLLFFGFIGSIKIFFFGNFYLIEIFAILFFVLRNKEREVSKRDTILKPMYALAAIWLFSQIVSDLFHNTPPDRALKGGLRIIFLILLINLFKKFTFFQFKYVAAGLLAGIPIFTVEFRNFEDLWKYSGGAAITLLFLFLIRLTVFRVSLLLLSSSTISLVLGSRFLFVCGLFTLLIFLADYRYKAEFDARKSRLKTIMVVLAVAPLSFGIYSYLATGGALGSSAQQKYISEAQDGSGFFLLTSRREIFYSFEQISSSPILGGGSYLGLASDVKEKALALQERLDVPIGDLRQLETENSLFPSHSYFFGSWVESGIFGGIFWMYVFVFIIRFLLNFRPRKVSLAEDIFSIYLSIFILWEILFSPFGQEKRIFVALLIAVIYHQKKQNLKT